MAMSGRSLDSNSHQIALVRGKETFLGVQEHASRSSMNGNWMELYWRQEGWTEAVEVRWFRLAGRDRDSRWEKRADERHMRWVELAGRRIVEVPPLCLCIETVLGQGPEASLLGSFVEECWQNSWEMIRPEEHLLGPSMSKAKQEIAAFIDLFELFTGTEMVIISIIPFSGSSKMSTIMGCGGRFLCCQGWLTGGIKLCFYLKWVSS